MAYTPTNWQDYPNISTAITAARLNNMEGGISAAYIQGTGTLANGDLAAGAAIAVSKLAPGSDTQVLTTTGGVPVWGTAAVGYTHPPGAIEMYGGAAAPTGWVLCDGSSLLRAGTFAALFAVIGVSYGSVDGTHFTVPDMRGRFATGYAVAGGHADVSTLGNSDGVALASRRPKHKHLHTLAISGGSHSHSDSGHSHGITSLTAWNGNGGSGGSGTGGTTGDRNTVDVSGTGNGNANIGSNTHSHATGEFSGGVGPQTGAEPVESPGYLVLNYIIKT